MNRKNIINKLVNEGFSHKTLSGFSDKQLETLLKTVVNEQTTDTTMNIPKEDTKSVQDAKSKKQKFVTYENDESELTEDSWDAKFVPKAHKKVNAFNDKKTGKPKGDKVFSDDDDDSRLNKKDEFYKKLNSSKFNPETKELEAAEGEIKENSKKNKIKNWVRGVTNENYHNFTSKGEIMELITTKMGQVTLQEKSHNGIPEFMTYDSIVDAAEPSKSPSEAPVKTPVKTPSTEPGKVDPRKTPFQPKNPNQPKVQPGPKASVNEVKK